MKITFQKHLQLIQTDVKTHTIKVLKLSEGKAEFKVKAVGASVRLSQKYPSRAINASEAGDFYYLEDNITMEEDEKEKLIEIEIRSTDRTKEGIKYFNLKLINITEENEEEEDENYEFSPFPVCHCFLIENVKEYLEQNIDRYRLPLTTIINNNFGKKDSDKENDGGDNDNNAPIKKIPIKGKSYMKVNQPEYNGWPFNILYYLGYDKLYDKLHYGKKYGWYKLYYLTEFTPGIEYEFLYDISSLSTNEDITLELLDMNMVKMIPTFLTSIYTYNKGWDDDIYLGVIGFAKRNCKRVKISKDKTQGKFKITPTESHRLITFLGKNPNTGYSDTISWRYTTSKKEFLLRYF